MDVDIVVLWVDGNDPAWQAEKRKYSPQKEDNTNAANRFRDWDLMKYWFRGIETFTPWFRTLHFVTWGHLPSFLDTSSPRLHIVRHEDFMPPEALPTFSSRALEMNIHRIEGLADHFIYFNDDMFVTRPMAPARFFDEKTGLPTAQFCELPCYFKGHLNAWEIAIARSLGIINKWFPKKDVSLGSYFGKYCSFQYPFADNMRNLLMKIMFSGYYTGIRLFHSPAPYLKRTFEEIWEKEPDLLQQTTMHRFRNTDDVNQILPFCWQLVSGQFVPCRMRTVVNDVKAFRLDRLCEQISRQQQDMICLNDSSEPIDFEMACAKLQAAFETILPHSCSFEKTK